MAKLVRVEFIRSPKDGQWMVFEKFEDGNEQGGRRTREDMEAIFADMFRSEDE